jgi:hypothetical protein
MAQAHKPQSRPHPHVAHGSGGHLVQPRPHKYAAAVWFLGRRRRVYDRLIALSGAREGDTVLDVPKCTRLVPARRAIFVGADNTICPFAGPFFKPSDRLEPSTPPCHGGFGASRAYTRDHARHGFSCKSGRLSGERCVARRRPCLF